MTEGYGAKRRADRWVEGFVEHWEHEFTVYSIRRLPAEKHATMHDTETLITTEPTPEEMVFLEDRLDEFNATATGIDDGEWLAIFVRDDEQRIVAGICGCTWGGCAEIRQLWVDESRRKKGLGTRLLEAAEREARRRGCRKMLLMTFSFQAPAFYARHGFQVVAVVEGHPRGHQNLLMHKRLDAAP